MMASDLSPLNGFTEKVALVTGAGSGIGKATAKRFAEEGASVAVVDLDDTAGSETVDEITANEEDAIYYSVDVSDPDSMADLFEEIVNDFGRLDFIHNNAGIYGGKITLQNNQLSKFKEEHDGEMDLSDVPLGRMAEPAEVAGAVVWLCSNDASYITGHSL